MTCEFDGHRYGECEDAIERVAGTVTRIQSERFAVALLGTTTEVHADGHRVEVTARYEPPSKGTVGHLDWRAGCRPADPHDPSNGWHPEHGDETTLRGGAKRAVVKRYTAPENHGVSRHEPCYT